MYELKQRFDKINDIDWLQRVDHKHLLDLYIGKDVLARYVFFVILDKEPMRLESTKSIKVEVGLRKDQRWGITFVLKEPDETDIFLRLVNDLIESTRFVSSKETGNTYLLKRYKSWMRMLAEDKLKTLDTNEVKGLIGELLFMEQYLFGRYGADCSILAWTGAEKNKQDFIFENIWYEVKTISQGNDSITISSVEQLDKKEYGELVIVTLERTSALDSNKINLNLLYNRILNKIQHDELKIRFQELLMKAGYYCLMEYEKYCFAFTELELYAVNHEFPCIRRSLLPVAITSVKYQISLSSICEFMRKKDGRV